MKVRRVLAVAALLVLAVAGWLAWDRYSSPAVPDVPLDGADAEMNAVIGKALDAVRRSPRSPDTWGELSLVLVANGLHEPAIGCLVQTERLDPAQPRWPYWHGILLLSSNPQQGILKLEKALALSDLPEARAAVLFPLTRILVEIGRLDEAAGYLQRLREIEGDSSRVHYALGLLAIGRGDRAGARAHLSRVADADSPFARKQACTLLAGLAEGDEALARKYRQRVAQLPNDQRWPSFFETELRPYRVDPKRRMAPYHEMVAQGRPAEAVDYLRQLAAQTPDEDICLLLGLVLFQSNEYEEAARALRQAAGFNPTNPQAHYLLGAVLLARGEKRQAEPDSKEQALELFRQAIAAEDEALRLQEAHAQAQLVRGKALKHLGRKKEALQALRAAAVAGPEFAEIHLALGEALAETGEINEALKHLENAVRVARPEDSRPRQALRKWQGKAGGPS